MIRLSERVRNLGVIALLVAAVGFNVYALHARGESRTMVATAGPGVRRVKEWREVGSLGQTIGPGGVDIVISEFSDFQCPFCARVQPVLRQVLDTYKGKVAIRFIHWPQEAIHPYARDAANAAECAAEQGRFAAMHDALFQRQDSIGHWRWTEYAVRAGVNDSARFIACVTSRVYDDRIAQGSALAARFGARGTPFFLVNDRVVDGAQPFAVFDSLIAVLLVQVP